MHDVMAGYVERGEIPGLVYAVERRGEIHVENIGAERDAIFRISSMTKPVTAVATLLLVEDGKLALDEPVDRLLPELARRRVLRSLQGSIDDTVPARRAVTVRGLLTFTWGFGMLMQSPEACPILKAAIDLGIGMGPPNPDAMPAPDEWLRRLGTLPLMFQPGERWLYNNGADVLGVLVARASGKPFDAFLAERVFEPLGMKDTGFSVPADKVARLVTSYWNRPEDGELVVYDPAAGGQWSHPPAFPQGSAGLVSTADDFVAFARALRDGRLLSSELVRAMTTDQLTPAQKAVSGIFPGEFDDKGWGFGVSVVTRRTGDGPPVGSYGWDGGLGTAWRNDPASGTVAVLMTQRAWRSPRPPPICDDFWKGVFAPTPPAPRAA